MGLVTGLKFVVSELSSGGGLVVVGCVVDSDLLGDFAENSLPAGDERLRWS